MSKSLSIPYYPGPVPTKLEDLQQYLFEELNKIQQSFVAQPVAMTVSETFVVNVTTTVNWQRMFIGTDPTWDAPGGSWDPINGEYNVPKDGLYQVILDARVNPYGAGNKTYYAGVAILHLHRDLTLDRYETTDGGDDAIPLGITMAIQIPLSQGDRIYFEATVVHDQFIGTTTVDASSQLLNVSQSR